MLDYDLPRRPPFFILKSLIPDLPRADMPASHSHPEASWSWEEGRRRGSLPIDLGEARN